MLRREIALHHTVAYTHIKQAGRPDKRIYVLYVLSGIECQPTAMMPLIEYILEHGRTRSLAWQRELTRSVGLFVDFLTANHEHFKSESDRPLVLAEFAEALVGGTVRKDGFDPSALFWEPKTTNRASVSLNAITGFGDWLVQKYDTTPINPWRNASIAEQIAYWRRFDKRRTNSLLAHTFGRDEAKADAKITRQISIRRKSISHDLSPAKFFPEKRIWELLSSGFLLRGKEKSWHAHERMNIRDMMITILLHGGGLRESEPFHLFVSDIAIDPRNPDSALIRLYHPERGSAPQDYIDPVSGNQIKADREEYLRVKWGLQPRNLVPGRYHAGWKELKMSNGKENYTVVNWFPSYWGEVFMALFKVYITKIRSRHEKHPYLFVSIKNDVAGDVYTVGSFRQAHANAVKRIGLVPCKEYGTTPHGHRHAYAQSMTDAGVPSEVIQAALHHKSSESQNVYKEPTAEKVNASLKEASLKLQPAAQIADLLDASV